MLIEAVAFAIFPQEHSAQIQPPSLRIDDLTLDLRRRIVDIRSVRPGDEGADEILLEYLAISVAAKAKHATAASIRYGNEELSWGLGYDLQAAVEAFGRTRDPRFLDIFESGFDVALSLRDDALGRRDVLRNKVMPAWGTYAYSDTPDTWIAWDALTGMLIYPAVHYSALVLSDETLHDRHGRASYYLARSRESLAAFDPWWREEGYYYDPLYKSVAPLNHMTLLGSAHVVMCSSFSAADSCRKAVGLSTFFRKHLRRTDGECIWSYWEGVDQPDAPGEDLTHAFLNVEFADIAHQEGIVFSDTDMHCIASAFLTHVVRRQGDWASLIDGQGNLIGDGVHVGLADFVRLGRYRPEIVPLIHDFMLANEQAFPLGLLSYATGPKAFALLLGSEAGHRFPRVVWSASPDRD